MDVLNIPGFAEAVLKERTVRDAAFIGLTESVGPFELTPLTLRQWIILRLVNNPLLKDGTPTPQDVVNFLWLLSPKYHPVIGRKQFHKRCRKLFFPPRYLPLLNTKKAQARHEVRKEKRMLVAAQIIDAIRAFVQETMQDRPPAPPNTANFEADYYSDGAYFCAVFGREFGWSQDEVLNTPLKRLFQYLNALKQSYGSKVPLCNPSDRIKARFLREIRERKLNPPNGH